MKFWITKSWRRDLLFLALVLAGLLAVRACRPAPAAASTMVDIPGRAPQEPARQPADPELQRGQVLRCQVREIQMAIVIPAEQAAGVLSYTQLTCGPYIFRVAAVQFSGAGPQTFISKGRDQKSGMLLLQPALPVLFGVEAEEPVGSPPRLGPPAPNGPGGTGPGKAVGGRQQKKGG